MIHDDVPVPASVKARLRRMAEDAYAVDPGISVSIDDSNATFRGSKAGKGYLATIHVVIRHAGADWDYTDAVKF